MVTWSPRYGTAVVLQSVTANKSYKRNLELDPTPRSRFTSKEMQTTKEKMKHTTPWLLSVITKMQFKNSSGLDFDTRLSSDFDQSKLWPLASKLSTK